MSDTLLILGGSGNAGSRIARLLLEHTEVRVVLAGRNLIKAQARADELGRGFGAERVSALRADAADPAGLAEVLRGVRLVVVASGTIPHTANLARAALEAGADYLDIQLSSPSKLEALRQLRSEIERAGRTFITDGGFHPGVPAALARWAALRLERLERAKVSSVIQENWGRLELTDSTVDELVEEFRHFRPRFFRDGAWKTAGWTGYPRFDLGPPFGPRACTPMFMEELGELPRMIPTLRETGFYVSGFNAVSDYLATPLLLLAFRTGSSGLLRRARDFFAWSLRAFSRPPFGTRLMLEAEGWQGQEPARLRLKLSHEDGYFLTAAPVVAALSQYLEGRIPPGLWLQAHAVEPERFLRDLERLGVGLGLEFHPNLSTPDFGGLGTGARGSRKETTL